MAITNATVVPKIIAAQLLIAYRQRRVFSARVDNTWRNALNAGGNEVIINRPLAGSVADYNRSTRITYDQKADVNTNGLTLQLGGTGGIGMGGVVKFWHVKFDDLDRALSRPDLLPPAVREYGEALANQVDADVRTAMLAGAPTVPAKDIDLDSLNPDGARGTALDAFGFDDLHVRMDFKRVPREGRWLIVGPAFAQALQKSVLGNETLMATPQQAALANGRVGSVAGFTIYVTDPAYSTFTAGSGSGNNRVKPSYTETVVCGVNSATAFIDRINRTERLRLQDEFADAVRGLYEYNCKVLQPERILRADYKISGNSVTNIGLPAAIT